MVVQSEGLLFLRTVLDQCSEHLSETLGHPHSAETSRKSINQCFVDLDR